MKLIEVEIRGITAFLMHRFSDEAADGAPTRGVKVDRNNPREEAAKSLYQAPDGTYYFSAFSIPGCMAAAGANHKMKGTRKTLRFVVPSAVLMQADVLTLLNGEGPAQHWEVDSRPVTIPATKGRVMRHRPRFDQWGARFCFQLDEKQLSVADAHGLLNEGGNQIGVGDFRPEKRGPFGRFRVVSFKEVVDNAS